MKKYREEYGELSIWLFGHDFDGRGRLSLPIFKDVTCVNEASLECVAFKREDYGLIKNFLIDLLKLPSRSTIETVTEVLKEDEHYSFEKGVFTLHAGALDKLNDINHVCIKFCYPYKMGPALNLGRIK